jgi:hypothetical protein
MSGEHNMQAKLIIIVIYLILASARYIAVGSQSLPYIFRVIKALLGQNSCMAHLMILSTACMHENVVKNVVG